MLNFNLTPAYSRSFFDSFFPGERELDRLFFGRPAVSPAPRHFFGDFGTDVSLKDNVYTLSTNLPGFTKEEVSLSFLDGVLTVSAKHEDKDTDDEKDEYVIRERRAVSYERKFSFDNADADAITASLSDGVLTVKVPVREEIKPDEKTIAIA